MHDCMPIRESCGTASLLACLHDSMLSCLYADSAILSVAVPRCPLRAALGDISRGVLCGALRIIEAVAGMPCVFAHLNQLLGGIVGAESPRDRGHGPDEIHGAQIEAAAGLVRLGAVEIVLVIRPLTQIAAFE